MNTFLNQYFYYRTAVFDFSCMATIEVGIMYDQIV